jgi:glycosyltransferase involved in cell wall biosynthesis
MMSENFYFSIVIPTWNNQPYLELCINSIRKNSHFKNQIIIFVNEGKDGTADWLRTQPDVDFLHSSKNEGICVAMNSCRSLIKSEYMVYMNDDMYVCPNWDLELYTEIQKIGHDNFMLSATLIEPYATTNPSVVSIVQDFGDSLETFKEKELLATYKSVVKKDWYGASWPPSVVSTRVWDVVGGYSIEFSPGMYSDPDFSMKLWKYGIRIFKGIGNSRVYHFQSKSTKRLKKNKGSDTFLIKWGITARVFYAYNLRMGRDFDPATASETPIPSMIQLRSKLKRAFKVLLS